MKKILFILTTGILLVACKSKKDILTSHPWYLWNVNHKVQLKDTATILKFYKDGTFTLTENGISKSIGALTNTWQMKGKDITLKFGNYTSDMQLSLGDDEDLSGLIFPQDVTADYQKETQQYWFINPNSSLWKKWNESKK